MFGLHGHAIILSLPPVFLVWATVSFTAAIFLYTIQNIATPTDGDAIETIWSVICMAAFGMIVILVLLALYSLTVMWNRGRGIRNPILFAWRISKTPDLHIV